MAHSLQVIPFFSGVFIPKVERFDGTVLQCYNEDEDVCNSEYTWISPFWALKPVAGLRVSFQGLIRCISASEDIREVAKAGDTVVIQRTTWFCIENDIVLSIK